MDKSASLGEFGPIFDKSVPHILEKIFFSLDQKSYKTCLKVNKVWNELLSTESYQKIVTKMLNVKQENEKLLKTALCTGGLGQIGEIKRLLSSGGWIDVNSDKIWESYTPLTKAISLGDKGVVLALLDAGADPDPRWCMIPS